jgi:HK97 family phage portal protein
MTSSLAIIQRDWDYPMETRSSLESTQTPLSYPAEWLLDIFQGGRTDSGIRVSELTAFQTSTFLACVDIIAGKIGALPRHVYERTLWSGRSVHRIAFEHDYYDLVALEPNDEMSGNTWMKAFLIHCLAWGNGYSELQRDAGNNVVAIWPRNPDKTRPRRLTTATRLDAVPWRPFPVNLPAGTMVYETTDGVDDNDHSEMDSKSRAPRLIAKEDMIHVPGLAFDGRLGQSVVWLARQTLGLALATEKFGAKYFANFAKPGGILNTPSANAPGTPQHDKAKQSWLEAQGGENSHRVAVMPPGWTFTPMSHNPEQAQTIDTRKYVRSEICAILHVPPHMVGDTTRSGANSVEQQAQELKEYCLDPWISAIRVECKRKLFPHRGIGRTPRSPFYVDFDLSEMLRPDAASRMTYYASGKQWGYLNSNDVRAMEKQNPIEDELVGEEFWMPANMTLATTPMDPTHQDGSGTGDVPPEEPETKPKPKPGKTKKKAVPEDLIKLQCLPGFRDGIGRILAREKRDIDAFKRCFQPLFSGLANMYRSEASDTFECAASGDESGRFISEYLGGMLKRSKSWRMEAADELASQELERAVRAIRVAVYREVATVLAKQSA